MCHVHRLDYFRRPPQVLALNSTVSPRITPKLKKGLQHVRDQAWAWLVKYPLANNNWCAFCEDITLEAEQWVTYGNTTAVCNYDSIQPLLFAQYLLHNRDNGNFDLDWRTHVPALIDFVERKLIFWEPPGPPGPNSKTQPAVQFGARAVSEQRADANRMSCHTTRYASTLKQCVARRLLTDRIALHRTTFQEASLWTVCAVRCTGRPGTPTRSRRRTLQRPRRRWSRRGARGRGRATASPMRAWWM